MAATEAKSAGFWETRTGWKELKEKLLLEPLPGGARWAAAFGSLLLFAFVIQLVTGILLAMNYAPSEKTAYASVKYIQDEVSVGSFIRSVHHWGSSAMVILLLVHLMQVFVWGAYKRPREFTWVFGVLLLFCTLGLAFTGYLLPWDQKAYWATRVGLSILGTVPWAGDGLRTWLQSGPEIGNLTLTRFFAIHGFVLPGLLIGFVVVHLYLFRQHGVTPGWWHSAEQLEARKEPFWPRQAFKDSVLALLFLVGLGIWCSYHQAPLKDQADPSQPYEARPEWYFMFLFQILKYFEGPYEVVGTFILPAAFFLILLCWPFLDRSPERNPLRRPVAMSLLLAGTAGLVGLTIYANATDVRMREPTLAAAKASGPKEPADPLQRLAVARLYADNCTACHGVDGSGKEIRPSMPTIPDFTSPAWQMSQTNLEIVHRIEAGNAPLMPPFRDKLTSAQNLGLAVYVRAFAPEPGPGLPPGMAATTPETQPKPKAPAKGEPAPAAVASSMSAVQLYRAYCLACHDADGRATIIRKAMPNVPDFTDPKWQTSRPSAELAHSILEGKGPFMLPMKGKLAAVDVDALVAYIRGFRERRQVVNVQPSQPVIPPRPEQPAVIPSPPRVPKEPPRLPPSVDEAAVRTRMASVHYRQYCLSCHGVDGRGTETRASMPNIPDFKDQKWQEKMTNAELAASILDGKGTLMPAFRGRVDEDEAQDLVAYIRAFGPAPQKAARPPTSDFEKRFRELQEEWNTLQKQLQKGSAKRE